MASDVPSKAPRFFMLDTLLGGLHDTEFSRTSDNLGPGMNCPQCGSGHGI